MATDLEYLYQGLKNAGYSDAQAAGILGNSQVETAGTFDPSIVNQHEQAIGWFQWEGGRREALQALSSKMGTTETDPKAQLAFFFQEFNSPQYDSLRSQIKGSTDPSEVAGLFDQYFERSSGAARTTREQDAQSIYQAIVNHTLASYAPSSATTNDAQPALFGIPGTGSGLYGSGGSEINGPVLGSLLNGLNPIHGIDNAIKALAAPIIVIGEFFDKLAWIFNTSHFIKFMLYVGGGVLVLNGIVIMVYGAGKERPM